MLTIIACFACLFGGYWMGIGDGKRKVLGAFYRSASGEMEWVSRKAPMSGFAILESINRIAEEMEK